VHLKPDHAATSPNSASRASATAPGSPAPIR
jgi:hypothetical protein